MYLFSHHITVIVILEAKPGKENELAQALKKVVEPSRAEDICVKGAAHKRCFMLP